MQNQDGELPRLAGSLPSEPRRGRVDRSLVEHVHQHELDTADSLAALGHDVTFIPRHPGLRSPDVHIDGVSWEIKAPRTARSETVVASLRSARGQSRRVILDLTNSQLTEGEALAAVNYAILRYRRFDEIRILGFGRPINVSPGGQ